ncbi:caveolin-2 [Sinocyclocheilus grahami]|uniref:Caveolin n=1 Tax=Sinocyclocheilus grahami TaxID=75366 RepID=A0A672SIS0_SINGR|nr:PREDICTED: caveolin-2-like [Sinocyclocheilus grahami]XP_016118153.1 PREDICTED: caveolin-2-like [Sinocyclocheilus grahami]
MGLEKEKMEASVIMDEDEFNRSIEPILGKKPNVYSEVQDRDPKEINAHLKVGFEDIIAEPISTHSFDRVWIGSHAVFELVKYVFYRILTTFLAIPMAFIAGIVFGILSCIHIWVVMPVIQGCMMTLPSIHVIWTSLMDMFIGPFFFSIGRCLSSISVKTVQN